MMNAWQGVIPSALAGAAGGLALIAAVVKLAGRGWAEGVLEKKRAGYSQELEALRARYAKELEAIRARLEGSVLVRKVHFETEFDALKQTFQAATRLKQSFMGLRPMVGVEPDDEGERRRLLGRRLSDTIDYFNAFISTSENLSPFYPQEIHREFEECARVASVEIGQIQTAGHAMFTPGWFEQGSKNQGSFGLAYHRASDLIRARIAKLAILEDA